MFGDAAFCTAAGTASALSENLVGYITVSLNNTDRKIPHYNV